MQRYLESKDEVPAGAMTAAVPISTRTPEQAHAGGNQVSMMVSSMHTDVADPMGRLAAIHESTAASKAAQEGVAVATLRDLAEVIPGALIGIGARAGASFAGNGLVVANTLVTNTPGPRIPLYFAGARVEVMTGCTPLANGVGLAHSISSYVDDFGVHVTACRELMPDIAFYVDCVERSFDELVTAAGA
jgi:WS/DGAT/MGAT family acyltransferase